MNIKLMSLAGKPFFRGQAIVFGCVGSLYLKGERRGKALDQQEY